MASRLLIESKFEPSEGEFLIRDLRALRSAIVTSWQERAVVLTRSEQAELRDEIKTTCELLTGLVASS
jgi:hypothetical protein